VLEPICVNPVTQADAVSACQNFHENISIATVGSHVQVERTKNGKIIVNEFCQIDHYHNVFSIGDIAAVKDWNGKLYPP
jgi:NADH dehydrogenase FAD-containing subunit